MLYSQICDLHPSIPAYRPPYPGVTIQSLQMDQSKEETKAKNGVIMCNLTVITTNVFSFLFSFFLKGGYTNLTYDIILFHKRLLVYVFLLIFYNDYMYGHQ